MKTYTTTTIKGNKLKFEISYLSEMVKVEHDLDGHICDSKERVTKQEIKTFANNEYIGSNKYLFISTIKGSGYEKQVPASATHYIKMDDKALLLTEKQANELNEIFKIVKEEGKTEEVKAIEKKEIEKEIEEAKVIVEKAENQRIIPTKEEAKRMWTNYNNLHNEGGDGYVPHIIDKDEYNWALKVLGR